jgi:hypothetical protein
MHLHIHPDDRHQQEPRDVHICCPQKSAGVPGRPGAPSSGRTSPEKGRADSIPCLGVGGGADTDDELFSLGAERRK